jgi:hypothetical protein
MKYSLIINISDEKIVIASVDGSVSNTFSNLVVLGEDDKFVSIGRTPEEIREDAPQEWEELQDKIHFCKPFSLDSFRPELASSTLEYLVFVTTRSAQRSQLPWNMNSAELFLQIPGYERLSASTQELFEFHLQELGLGKYKTVSINNQPKALSKIHQSKQMARLVLSIIFAFLMASMMSLIVLLRRYSAIPEEVIWTFSFVYIVAVFFLAYLASFIFVALWKYATRNLISDSIARKIMESNNVGLPKFLLNRIWQKLPSKVGGG